MRVLFLLIRSRVTKNLLGFGPDLRVSKLHTVILHTILLAVIVSCKGQMFRLDEPILITGA